MNSNRTQSKRHGLVLALGCVLALPATVWLRQPTAPGPVAASSAARVTLALAVAPPASDPTDEGQSSAAPAVEVPAPLGLEREANALHVDDAGPVSAGDLEAPFVPVANEAGLSARSVANADRRVGLDTRHGETRPVLLEPGRDSAAVITPLAVLHGGAWSVALGVNGGGEAVGSAGLAEGNERPVRWLENGEAIEMDTLAGGRGRVNAINGEGLMVGWSLDGDGQVRATLWGEDGMPIDLNTRLPADSGWQLEQALSVSDAGTIQGIGRLHGEQRLFRITLATGTDMVAQR